MAHETAGIVFKQIAVRSVLDSWQDVPESGADVHADMEHQYSTG